MIIEQPDYLRKKMQKDKASSRVEQLQRRINDEAYLHAAIQRLALVLSRELMEITIQGRRYERKRRQ